MVVDTCTLIRALSTTRAGVNAKEEIKRGGDYPPISEDGSAKQSLALSAHVGRPSDLCKLAQLLLHCQRIASVKDVCKILCVLDRNAANAYAAE